MREEKRIEKQKSKKRRVCEKKEKHVSFYTKESEIKTAYFF
jgi:hypothetical protein